MFRTVPLFIIRSFSLYTQQWYIPVLILLASYQQTCMTYTIAVCTVKTPDGGQRDCPKHVEFNSKNKFEELMCLVGFIIRSVCVGLYSSIVFITLTHLRCLASRDISIFA